MILKLSYLILSLIVTVLLVLISTKAKGKFPIKFVLILFGWHVYIYFLAVTGLIGDLDFPPKFALFTIIPAFIFSGYLFYHKKVKTFITNVPPHWLIFYQVFRIGIEIIFVFSVSARIYHKNVSIEGYNFDMVYAITALLIGWLLYKSYGKFRIIALYWNYLGLLVILVIIAIFQTSIYLPEIYGTDTESFPIAFLNYPFILIPSFLMPSAVLIHAMSILQLRNKE